MNTEVKNEVKVSRTQFKIQNNVLAQQNRFSGLKGAQAYQAEQRKAAINNLTDPRVVGMTGKERRALLATGVDVGIRTRTEPKPGTTKLLMKLNGRGIKKLAQYQRRLKRRENGLNHQIEALSPKAAEPVVVKEAKGIVEKGLAFLKNLKRKFEAVGVATPGASSDRLAFITHRRDMISTVLRCVNGVIAFRMTQMQNFQDAKELAELQKRGAVITSSDAANLAVA